MNDKLFTFYGRCLNCNKDFTYTKTHNCNPVRKYCCDKCKHEGIVRMNALKRKEKEKQKYAPKQTLEKHLRELGIRAEDYANYQKAQTLRMCGRVLV